MLHTCKVFLHIQQEKIQRLFGIIYVWWRKLSCFGVEETFENELCPALLLKKKSIYLKTIWYKFRLRTASDQKRVFLGRYCFNLSSTRNKCHSRDLGLNSQQTLYQSLVIEKKPNFFFVILFRKTG